MNAQFVQELFRFLLVGTLLANLPLHLLNFTVKICTHGINYNLSSGDNPSVYKE